MFERILIANRGEIACRVIETARRMGIGTVAVYSEADRDALHVRRADRAIAIGPAPAAESYLVGERILEAARRAGAQAVHPGYGFLSENAVFAEACASAGLVFIGPSPEAILTMGRKDAAKARMEQAGVPVVPGYHGEEQDPERLRREALAIGFPLLVKAVAGGGGKGMRIARTEQELPSAVEAARREAEAAFGDGQVLLERYLVKPRHIELQVFGDAFGNVVHLFERDCSLQRRHQKVIEEAPAPDMTDALRKEMGDAAVCAARSIGYTGAGTVEFIVDVSSGLRDAPFYFMEMNTRLQVEHPVSEAITGTDLVEWQLRVAAGEPLPCSQADLAIVGHAIEARVYAEDPARGDLPQTGRLIHLRTPETGPRVRVDTGVREGDEIGIHYDPMIAKLIVHGEDRNDALKRLRRALLDFSVIGLKTNLPLLRGIAGHPAFAAGDLDTGFLDRHADVLRARDDAPVPELVALACAGLLARRAARARAVHGEDPWSPWSDTRGFRLHEDGHDLLRLRCEQAGETRELEVTARFPRHSGLATASSADPPILLEWGGDGGTPAHQLALGGITLSGRKLGARIDDRPSRATFVEEPTREGERIHVESGGVGLSLVYAPPGLAEHEEDAGDGAIRAPMPGKVIALLVARGDRVARGQPLLRLEAMKMEHTLVAPHDGVVEALAARPGEQVAENAVIIRVRGVDDEATHQGEQP